MHRDDVTVEEAHTLAVGDGQWVVHNVDCKRLNTNVAQTGEMMREVYTELSNAPKDAAVRTEMMSDFAKQIKEAADNNGWGQWNANEFPLVDAAGNPTGGAIFIGDGAHTQAIVDGD